MALSRKTRVMTAFLGAFMYVGQASAFNFGGMGNLSNFIKDIVELVPDLITLAVYGAILSVIGVLILWLKKFFGKGMG